MRILTHPHGPTICQTITSEQPFKIALTEGTLALLKRKLDDTRLPDEVNAADWAYGVPVADIRRLASRWKDGYGWRTHERELNARSAAKRATLLLFVPQLYVVVSRFYPVKSLLSLCTQQGQEASSR